ncbi:MAG: BNR-4 repeat-containing protein [Verrucomicrobiota bacterium]
MIYLKPPIFRYALCAALATLVLPVLSPVFSTEPPLPTVSVTKLFTLPGGADTGDNTYSPLWSSNGKTFLVWRDSTMHPMVTEIPESGTPSSVPLDPNPKYMAQYREVHHSYSLGVDKNGFIHITGDMHDYPGANDKFQPARYRNKQILYWRSKSPNTVMDGFEFVGGDPAKAIPGTKWSDGAFYGDNQGELYYLSRVLATGGAHTPVEMGIGLFHYDAATGSWSALGAEPPHISKDAEYHSVLFWEVAAASDVNREARGTIRFDKQNRMHFAAPAATSAATAGMNALVYACSEDGGKTWKRANGTPIAALPMRAVAGPSQADIVAAFNQNGVLAEFFASDDFSGDPALKQCEQQLKAPPAQFNSARWSGEIVFPDAGTYTIQFDGKAKSAILSLINKQKGGQDPETGKLRDGNAQQLEVEKGMTLGFCLKWTRQKTDTGLFAPHIRWQKEGGRMEEIPLANLLPGHTRFDLYAGVAADETGAPAIACNPSNNLVTGTWRYWDKSKRAWTEELCYPGDCQQQNKICAGPDGMLTFESVVGVESYYVTPKVEYFRTSAFNVAPKAYFLPNIYRIAGTDEYGYRRTGVYRTLVFDNTTQFWAVAKINLPLKQ